MKKLNLRKNDIVIVIRGNDKGKKGKILKVLKQKNKAIVEGINIVKKHKKARKQGEQSGIIEISAPVDLSKLMLVCPKCNEPTKVGRKTFENKHVRICKKCGEMIVR